MVLRILVPLDGSPRAERALDLATAFARQAIAYDPTLEPLLILFLAIDLPSWLDLEDREDERVRAAGAASHYLTERARRLRNQGITVETAVRLGNPVETIVEQTTARQAELLIMSTHSRNRLGRWALGSVAERVARSTPVPLLLLPDAAPAMVMASEARNTVAPPQILVPLDGSARAEAALPAAMKMARLLQAEVRLLHVFVPKFEEHRLEEIPRTWDASRRQVHQIERYLMRQTEIIQRAGIKARWAFASGMPGTKIPEFALNHHVSLVVMTTQGRSGLVRWRLGNVTDEVLHSGLLPVVLVPTEGAKDRCSPEAQEQQILAKETR